MARVSSIEQFVDLVANSGGVRLPVTRATTTENVECPASVTIGTRRHFFPIFGQGPMVISGANLEAVEQQAVEEINGYLEDVEQGFAGGLEGCRLSCIKAIRA